MNGADGYLRLTRGLGALGVGALLLGATVGGVFAHSGEYGKATPVGDGSFYSSTYNVVNGDTLYQYSTGGDGSAYYTSYDGKDWADWSAISEQPVKYKGDPAPAVYGDKNYVVYQGENEGYYLSVDGGEWTDISDGYTFKCAPYANVYNDTYYVYGTADDGYVYWRHYDGSAWSDWIQIGDETTSAYEVYAFDWDGYNNVVWTSDDGSVYWNRWDGSAWTGTKALAGGGSYKYAPYAVGYAPEKKIYAYAVTADGAPAWNVFTPDEGWSGWKPYEGLTAKVVNQPNAYVYDDIQHLVFTGDDGHAYYTEYDGGFSDDWTDLGKNYAYDPYQYEYDGDLYLTYTGADYGNYVKAYEGEAGSGY